nr:MAG TPA: SECRETED 45 KDA PROTEIN CYCLE, PEPTIDOGLYCAN, CHAP, CELL [Caudoviricetes sp.]
MMTLELEGYQAIMLAITIGGSIFGAGKAFFGRIETSLKDRDDGLKAEIAKVNDNVSKESEAIRQLDREILKLKAELPREYVAKEDFIRSFTVVEAKIDAVQTTLTQFAKEK